jgi:hypothetical protein
MIQIEFGEERFAVFIKDFEVFLHEKGKKIDHNLYKVK